MVQNKEEIGQDVKLTIGDFGPFDLTSASYSEETSISSVQFNDSLSMNIVQTGVEFSGSFEHSGSNTELRDALFEQNENPGTSVASKVDTLIFEDSSGLYTFKNVLCGSRSKDFPADDRTSVTYDFTAETMLFEEVSTEAEE